MKLDSRHLKQVLFRCKACGADLTNDGGVGAVADGQRATDRQLG